jgi:hypothetical protein
MVSGCGTTGVASEPPSTAPPSRVLSTPTPSGEASPIPTIQASSPAEASLEPEPSLTPPPDATLQVEGGDPVIGELGSWSWMNAGSDAPYLPGYPIHVGKGERLIFAMVERVPIDSWQVRRVPPSSIPNDVGSVAMGEGTGDTIWFESPPEGTWAVSVEVWFAGTLGSAAYYWQVEVD